MMSSSFALKFAKFRNANRSHSAIIKYSKQFNTDMQMFRMLFLTGFLVLVNSFWGMGTPPALLVASIDQTVIDPFEVRPKPMVIR